MIFLYIWLIAWFFAGSPGFGIDPLLVFGVWCAAAALAVVLPMLRPLVIVRADQQDERKSDK